MTFAAPVHREYLVDDGCAARMARAAARYRLRRPSFVISLAVEILAGVLLIAAGQTVWGAALLIAGLLLPLILLLQSGTMARALSARGFRPGTTLQLDWYPDRFVVTTPLAHGTHDYRAVHHFAVLGSAAILRLHESRMLILLPVEVVPDEVRPALAGPHPHR